MNLRRPLWLLIVVAWFLAALAVNAQEQSDSAPAAQPAADKCAVTCAGIVSFAASRLRSG